jgi:hypothetical protein
MPPDDVVSADQILAAANQPSEFDYLYEPSANRAAKPQVATEENTDRGWLGSIVEPLLDAGAHATGKLMAPLQAAADWAAEQLGAAVKKELEPSRDAAFRARSETFRQASTAEERRRHGDPSAPAIAQGIQETASEGTEIAVQEFGPDAILVGVAAPLKRFGKAAGKRRSHPRAGETGSTRSGKSIHSRLAAERRAARDFDSVDEVMRDREGRPIEVSRRVDLKSGEPVTTRGTQVVRPDAVRFENGGLILDDKPLTRSVAKDRQEMIRNIRAFEKREGHLPRFVAIQRYDPNGVPVRVDLFKPEDFLPNQ